MASKYFNARSPFKRMSRKEEKDQAILAAFHVCMTITLFVLHDKFGFGGLRRLPRFAEEVRKLFDAYQEGYLNIPDMQKVLKDETGIEIKF